MTFVECQPFDVGPYGYKTHSAWTLTYRNHLILLYLFPWNLTSCNMPQYLLIYVSLFITCLSLVSVNCINILISFEERILFIIKVGLTYSIISVLGVQYNDLTFVYIAK